jgi:hypothetical protein
MKKKSSERIPECAPHIRVCDGYKPIELTGKWALTFDQFSQEWKMYLEYRVGWFMKEWASEDEIEVVPIAETIIMECHS